MVTTPVSLLQRLGQPTNQEAWRQFVQLYTPLLYAWARRLNLPPQDAADFVQDVFTLLVQKLPLFTYDERRRFRGWLWTVTRNKLRERLRRPVLPASPADPALAAAADDPALELAESEYRQNLVSRALALMQAEFPPQVWKACWEYAVAGRPAPEVADELGISVNSVYLAKSRVLRRLRELLDGLLD